MHGLLPRCCTEAPHLAAMQLGKQAAAASSSCAHGTSGIDQGPCLLSSPQGTRLLFSPGLTCECDKLRLGPVGVIAEALCCHNLPEEVCAEVATLHVHQRAHGGLTVLFQPAATPSSYVCVCVCVSECVCVCGDVHAYEVLRSGEQWW